MQQVSTFERKINENRLPRAKWNNLSFIDTIFKSTAIKLGLGYYFVHTLQVYVYNGKHKFTILNKIKVEAVRCGQCSETSGGEFLGGILKIFNRVPL